MSVRNENFWGEAITTVWRKLGQRGQLWLGGLLRKVIVVFLLMVLISCTYNVPLSTNRPSIELDETFAQIQTDIMDGNYDEAVRRCTEAIEVNPQSARAYRARGYVKWFKGDAPGAVRDINVAIELAPNDGHAYYVRALIEDHGGDQSEAISDYSRAMDLDASLRSAEVYTQRGFVRVRKGDLSGASDDFSKALKLNQLYPRAKQGQAAVNVMQKGPFAAMNDGILGLVEMFESPSCSSNGKGIQLSTKYRTPHLRMGLEACNGKEFALAIWHFDRAIQLSPNWPEAYNGRGFVYAQQDAFDSSIKDYRKALSVDPGFSPAKRNLEDLYFRLNKSPDFVKKIQGMLSTLDFYAGSIDGQSNDAYKKALTDFQKKARLPATGEVDDEVHELLVRTFELAKTSVLYDAAHRNQFFVKFPPDLYETPEKEITIDVSFDSESPIESFSVRINDVLEKGLPKISYNPDRTKANIAIATPLVLGKNDIILVAFTKKGTFTHKMDIQRKAGQIVSNRPGQKLAVVMGVGDYTDPKMAQLKYAGTDAESFAAFLINKGSYLPENVIILSSRTGQKQPSRTRQEPTSDNMKKALFSWLERKATKQDTIIIYYSGHGVLVSDQTSTSGRTAYLTPNDFDHDNPQVKGIKLEEIKRLAYLSSARIFLILDSCFSGGGQKDVKSVDYGLRIKAGSSDVTGGFSAMGQGRVLFASSQDNQVSLESDTLKAGVFTYYLLDVLRKGEKRISEIYRYVHSNVFRLTRGAQEPRLDSIEQKGDILIY